MATPVPDGWPPPPAQPGETEPGLQADSSAPTRGFTLKTTSDQQQRLFPGFQSVAASYGSKVPPESPRTELKVPEKSQPDSGLQP
ncbi:hypothetical protein SCA03_27280 [Streptomyces cacaoi]|uniref:Uncharacterized protein n=1 Tax=Streptomyces cacaoi TaxID=1898 RepID=A0A4Y3QZU7_STRCI|nr:hypothetical protein SCA03_27280 [Streptomyces cacaoi]